MERKLESEIHTVFKKQSQLVTRQKLYKLFDNRILQLFFGILSAGKQSQFPPTQDWGLSEMPDVGLTCA
jgi:hypothetical protein